MSPKLYSLGRPVVCTECRGPHVWWDCPTLEERKAPDIIPPTDWRRGLSSEKGGGGGSADSD